LSLLGCWLLLRLPLHCSAAVAVSLPKLSALAVTFAVSGCWLLVAGCSFRCFVVVTVARFAWLFVVVGFGCWLLVVFWLLLVIALSVCSSFRFAVGFVIASLPAERKKERKKAAAKKERKQLLKESSS
jgi:hypothetical protein